MPTACTSGRAVPAWRRDDERTGLKRQDRRGELRAAGGVIHVQQSRELKEGVIQPKSAAGVRKVPILGKSWGGRSPLGAVLITHEHRSRVRVGGIGDAEIARNGQIPSV